jgi:hypothetical protein
VLTAKQGRVGMPQIPEGERKLQMAAKGKCENLAMSIYWPVYT